MTKKKIGGSRRKYSLASLCCCMPRYRFLSHNGRYGENRRRRCRSFHRRVGCCLLLHRSHFWVECSPVSPVTVVCQIGSRNISRLLQTGAGGCLDRENTSNTSL